MKIPKTLTLLSIFALIGIGFGVELSQHYYEIRSGLASFHSFCNISSEMNCDRIAASPSAELLFGLPLSSFVAGWYLAFFVITLIARNRFWFRECARAILLMSGVGVAFSIVYFLVMATSLHTYCLFCLGVDVVNVAVLIGALVLKPEGLSVHKPEVDKWRKIVGVGTVSLVAVVIALKVVLDSVSLSSADITEHVDAALSMPVLPLNVTDSDPALGPKDAPVTIVEFSDFQCPYCRIGAMIMKSIQDRYPTQVRVVFKPFPMDQSCNREIDHPMHDSACEAARVGICANRLGKFEAVYENFFEHQTDIVPGSAAEMAVKQGVDAGQLKSCVDSQDANSANSALLKSIEEGIALSVNATPTFFVNGHRVEGVLSGPFWDKLVDRLLKK